jgi:hypothetical protein
MQFKFDLGGNYTNPARTDGFGAQLQSLIYTSIFCDFIHAKYYYSPINVQEHNYENNEKYNQILNHFLGLDSIQIIEKNNEPIHPLPNYVTYPVVESLIENFSTNNVIKLIRNNILKHHQNPKVIVPGKKIIAIHIRRKLQDDTQGPEYYTNLKYYESVVEKISRKLPLGGFQIVICSTGEPSDFEIFKKFKPTLFLNESITQTFSILVNADILVMSKSSFSYSAALLSSGFIVYQKFWHRKNKKWHTI